METDLHISERLKNLLPPLTKEERDQLRSNIAADEEVLDAIFFWNDGKKNVVLDGMHRWEMLRGWDIPYRMVEVKLASYEEAEIWILNHQLGRRNLLKPAAIRKIRGSLYNILKRKDGGHGNQIADRQNVGPLTSAAEQVGEKAGVSPRTVERDGARVAAAESLTKAAQAISDKASDAEIKAMAKLDPAQQDQVARAIRVGQASSVKEAMKAAGIKPSAAKKPTKQYDRSYWFKQWQHSIGPLVRLVDKIAHGVGEAKCQSHRTVQDHLEVCTEEMMEWLGVKK